ncbi:hypothetical protein GJ496_008484 [Pomphorhynchus laevis]|nr:hypothetical protein GJ496_008484 [Pomphorhynchus laevis]
MNKFQDDFCEENRWRRKIKEKFTCDANDELRFKCIQEYIKIVLQSTKFGIVKPISEEKSDDYFPTITVVDPGLLRDEEQISVNNENAVEALIAWERRKKFAVVQFEDKIYLMGGYIYEEGSNERKDPDHEYCFNLESKALQQIAKLPIARTNFSIATDGHNILVAGGQTYDNEPLRSCQLYNILTDKWTSLQPLPAPTSGAGIYYDGKFVHILGGYDIIGGQADIIGDYGLYSFENNSWTYMAPISRKRARPLLVMPDIGTSRCLHSIGGVYIDKVKLKAIPVPEIQKFDPSTKSWSLVTTIPNLQPSHSLAYDDGIVSVIERVMGTGSESRKVMDTKILHSFDIETNKWHKGPYKRKKEESEPKEIVHKPKPKEKSPEKQGCCGKKSKSKDKSKKNKNDENVDGSLYNSGFTEHKSNKSSPKKSKSKNVDGAGKKKGRKEIDKKDKHANETEESGTSAYESEEKESKKKKKSTKEDNTKKGKKTKDDESEKKGSKKSKKSKKNRDHIKGDGASNATDDASNTAHSNKSDKKSKRKSSKPDKAKNDKSKKNTKSGKKSSRDHGRNSNFIINQNMQQFTESSLPSTCQGEDFRIAVNHYFVGDSDDDTTSEIYSIHDQDTLLDVSDNSILMHDNRSLSIDSLEFFDN